jgi:hypothetical protein
MGAVLTTLVEQLRVQNEQLRVQNEQQRVQNVLLKQIGEVLEPVAREAQLVRLRRLDPWTLTKRTREEQAAWKEKLLLFYGVRVSETPYLVRCMLSGACLSQGEL